jgi:two-component system sensor histidine kinase KdpD
MVSHELKTPLTSVLGALDTLGRPELSLDNPAVQEMLTGARRQAVKLRRLIDDLLVTSRIDRGVVRPETRPVQLMSVVADAVAVVPRCHLSIDVPAELVVLGDPDHLGQVVTNLLENAVKYGADTPVAVRADAVSDRVVLTVSDHGPGIPSDQRDRVFERFVRLDGGDRARVGGTGLGLSIVKMLVDGMGGEVGVVDTPGGGATFVVTLASAA